MYAAPFSEISMIKIFSNILEWYFMNLAKPPIKTITNLKDNLVLSTIKLYQIIKVRSLIFLKNNLSIDI